MSAPTMAVGVVIPCHRQEHYLGEAIESVLAQTRQVDDILVVDDGSPGDCASLVARYPGVRYLRQVNRGISEARNTGLREARGTHLIFLDADDRLLPNAVADALAGFAAHPDAALVSGICRRIDGQGRPWGAPVRFECPGGDHYDALLRHNHIWPPAVGMYRRECLVAVNGWLWGRRHAQDLELYLRLARQYPFFCHPAEVAEYRIQESGRSQNRAAMLRGLAGVLRQQRAYVTANPRYRDAYREGAERWPRYYGEQLTDEIRAHFRAGRLRELLGGLHALLRYYPAGAAEIARGRIRRLRNLLLGRAG